MKKRMVKSAEQVNAEKLVKDSEVAVRIDVPETRTSSVKLEDLLEFRQSGDNVLATLRSDVGSFKRGHAFAKLVRREVAKPEGKEVSYVVIPFAFAKPGIDEITGAPLADSFAPSWPIRSRQKVRAFLARKYRDLAKLEGIPFAYVDAAEVSPVPVAEEEK